MQHQNLLNLPRKRLKINNFYIIIYKNIIIINEKEKIYNYLLNIKNKN